ncbi:tRNA 2-thiouridine(34) synthase MnmA [Candidatus Margulisiibacteriota bacterium]
MKKKTVLVGMSGGVDSSVVALMLKEQGYNVIGVTMQIWQGDKEAVPPIQNACFSPDEEKNIKEIEKICEKIGIPFYPIDLRAEFQEKVIKYFKSEYSEGRTPNPCMQCNFHLKFGALLEKARKIGLDFDYFATGHYVQVEYNQEKKRYLLKKGKDELKDQSYFLSFLKQKQLAQCMFPLGGFTKDKVREKAKSLGLGLEAKKQSQNFIAGGHKTLLENEANHGNILDLEGNVLGKHKGIQFHTIGQRKGLGLSSPFPLFVLAINKEKNTITVGPKAKLYKKELIADKINWILFKKPDETIEVTAKIRYVQKESKALVIPQNNSEVLVEFENSQMAITPGQIVVFYQEDYVVGAGIIK